MLGRQTGRKALVVFTDGEDQGSHVAIEVVYRWMTVIAKCDVAEFELRGHVHLIVINTIAHKAALTARAAARRAANVMRRSDQGAACAGCGETDP